MKEQLGERFEVLRPPPVENYHHFMGGGGGPQQSVEGQDSSLQLEGQQKGGSGSTSSLLSNSALPMPSSSTRSPLYGQGTHSSIPEWMFRRS